MDFAHKGRGRKNWQGMDHDVLYMVFSFIAGFFNCAKDQSDDAPMAIEQ